MEVEAGVVTERAMERAAELGLVFATDPTSAWASTIGGNISENAGGKLAVRLGSCIDNLLSRRAWPCQAARHGPCAARTICCARSCRATPSPRGVARWRFLAEAHRASWDEIRKKGLWKDVTNKALGGVPGLQKEGTDGVITSAEFVLYPEDEAERTISPEFFGPDMGEASRVIVELSKAFPFPDSGAETLMALEHFDDEYVRAIDYKVKASRAETPKAVLLIDVAGHTGVEAARGVERWVGHGAPSEHLLFEARAAAEARSFWPIARSRRHRPGAPTPSS